MLSDAPEAGGDPLAVRFCEVSYSYDGQTRALDDLTLGIPSGQFVCIAGANGSGKSTLGKVMSALLVPDEGSACVLGRQVSSPADQFFIRAHVGMVFQNPDDQLVASVVENDVAFGPENLGLPAVEVRKRVDAALARVGLGGFELSETSSLSGGQKQRVAIAGALALRPRMVVFDEATAMLDPRGRTGLLRTAHALHAEGITVVMISHFMEEAAEAERLIVLKNGRIAADGTPKLLLARTELLSACNLEPPFAARMSHALATAGVPLRACVNEAELTAQLCALQQERSRAEGFNGQRNAAPTPCAGVEDGRAPGNRADLANSEVGVKARAAQSERPCASGTSSACHNAHSTSSFALPSPNGALPDALSAHRAPLLALKDVSYSYVSAKAARKAKSSHTHGEHSWGKSADDACALKSLGLALYAGDYLGLAGHTGSGKSTCLLLLAQLLRPSAGCVIWQETPLTSKRAAREAARSIGIVLQYPERQLFAASVYDDVAFGPRNSGLPEDEVRKRVGEALDAVGLEASAIQDLSPFELSGGQQRCVAIAGVLACKPQLLLLDEPTAGLDPAARAALLKLIDELHESGLTVVMASHDMEALAARCTRLAIFNEGQLVACDAPERIFAKPAALHRIGLDVPAAQRLARTLHTWGFALPASYYDERLLTEQLCEQLPRRSCHD